MRAPGVWTGPPLVCVPPLNAVKRRGDRATSHGRLAPDARRNSPEGARETARQTNGHALCAQRGCLPVGGAGVRSGPGAFPC